MSAYVPVPPPVTDPHRAAALLIQLRRLAPVLTPAWQPTRERDDFLSALQQIAARLAEETTVRLDRTGERDALAFFDFLGLPADPPHAAIGVLVLTLAGNHPDPVYADPRTQLTTDDGASFETIQGLRVVAGRIAEVIAVDPAADRIEPAPADVVAVAPPTVSVASYQVVTFANTGSATLQLSPAVGPAPGDLLRIGTGAYRVASADKNGLVTLLDPLEAPAPAGTTTATPIRSLESFTLRNLQSHSLYIGHGDLLKLDQQATITLGFAPAKLVGELTGLDIAYSIWGTPDGQTDPDWQPLDLLGGDGSAIQLAKSWSGSTGQTEVGGRRNRWIRADLQTSMAGLASATDTASQVTIKVATVTADPAEGSRTITRAAHNNTPLSTAGRFLPFGPEPLRFDEFALAAPESLAKKGATVTLTVSVADATLTSFEVTPTGDTTALGGYGASSTGYLESITLGPGPFQWRELRPADPDGRPLQLAAPPAAVGVNATTVLFGVILPIIGPPTDVVVVREATGDRWAAPIRRDDGVPAEQWSKVPALGGAATTGRPVLAPAPVDAIGVTGLLLDAAGGNLNVLQLNEVGRPASAWLPPSVDPGPVPVLDADGIATVQGVNWPQRPAVPEIVVADRQGDLWLGTFSGVGAGLIAKIRWVRLSATGASAAAVPIRATATRYDAANPRLWIGYIAADATVHALSFDGHAATHYDTGLTADMDAVPHADPALLGTDGRPIIAVVGPAGEEVQMRIGAGQVQSVPLGGPASAGRALLVNSTVGTPPDLVVPGAGERVLRSTVPLPLADYALHNGVGVQSADPPHCIEVTDSPGDPGASKLVLLDRAGMQIKNGDLRIYKVDDVPLTAGTTTVRFLRFNPASGGSFTATFPDPTLRNQVQLQAADQVTRVGMSLIIGNASYRVTSLSGRNATLSYDVLGAGVTPVYQPASVLDSRLVTERELGTLVNLKINGTLDPSAQLVFTSSAQPAQQTPDQQQNGDGLWVRLPAAWITRPPDTGRVMVTGQPDPVAWTASTFDRGYENPELSWEYFDGSGWRSLAAGFSDTTRNLSAGGKITFTVPDDLATTEIGGATDYWIRARLIGGDYGRPQYVVTTTGSGGTQTQTVTVDNSQLRPPEIVAIEAGFTLDHPTAPQAVLVENNLDLRDETAAAAASTARFELFQGATALDPDAPERALYLGLTASPGQGSLVLLADAADQVGPGPIRVDLRTPDGWRTAAVDDTTRALRRRGLIEMTLDVVPVLVRLFGLDRVWLRLRAEPATTPVAWAPDVGRLLLNAVDITHARTVTNEILGSSLGEPSLTLALAETPVLPDTVELRVREDLGEDESVGLQVLTNPANLPGTWVLWSRVDSLIGQTADARVYLLDPGTGRVRFGDGRGGKVPPAGRDNIRCFAYQKGGGPAGNHPAWTAAKLTSAVQGVETVLLPIDTAGGYAAPPPGALLSTAPQRLRHAGQALSPADLEALAVASSADIVRARCVGPDGPRRPIRVTIAVRGDARCPIPTLAQRDAVSAALRSEGWGGLAEDSIEVDPPVFVHVSVTARLSAVPARLAEVEQGAGAALATLLDPIAGGPDGTGWPFGRRIVPTDVLRALAAVPGLDRVDGVEISAVPDRMPADGLICADLTDIDVVVNPLETTP